MKKGKRYKIWVISLAMSLALLGIIVVQVYWVKNAYDVHRDRFFRQVDDHLNFVVNQHEVMQTLALINEIDQKGFQGTGTFENTQRITAQRDSSQLLLSSYQVNINEFSFKAGSEKLPSRIQEMPFPYRFHQDNAKDSTSGGLSGSIADRDSQRIDFDKLKHNKDGRLFRLMRSFVRVYLTGDQSISYHKIDSLLKGQMRQVHPRLEYEYDIFKEQNDSIDSLYTGGVYVDKDCHIVAQRLFPSALEGDEAQIVLTVLEPHRYILSEMKAVMGLSAIFLLIIIYAFSYTLSSLIRQGKLSQMKSDFINNMTHELKTPISTISLASEALTDKSIQHDAERTGRLGELIRRENDRLRMQVERVLQMEKLDRNHIKLEKTPLHLNSLIQGAVENSEIQVDKVGGTITCRLDALKDRVQGDELHLSNVIYNLLDNALKYSEKVVEVHVESWNTDKAVFCSVADKGIGISNDLVDKVFERFYRVPTGNRHDVKGFGLGLSYVKEIIELHDGNIKVSSKMGKGSIFTIQLPLLKEK